MKAFLTDCFRFSGRMPRARYWILVTRFSMLAIAPLFLSIPLSTVSKGSAIGLASLTLLALIVVSCFAIIRRLHDLNWSGWWLLAIVPLYVLTNIVLDRGDAFGSAAAAAPLIIAYIAVLIALGFVRGTKGPNKYGPDPLV